MKGLFKTLGRVFFPDFKLKSDSSANRREAALEARGGAGGGRAPARGSFPSVRGRARGRMVDAEVQAWVSMGAPSDPGTHTPCYNGEKRGRRRWHPYTLKLIRALRAARMRPIDTQYVVHDSRSGIATGIDLVCEHVPSGSVVLCEIKCGFNGTSNEAACGPMRAPLASVSDCPRNQHQLQAACGEWMFRRCAPRAIERLESRVIRISDHGVHFDELEPWALRAAPMIMRHLGDKASRGTKKKK